MARNRLVHRKWRERKRTTKEWDIIQAAIVAQGGSRWHPAIPLLGDMTYQPRSGIKIMDLMLRPPSPAKPLRY